MVIDATCKRSEFVSGNVDAVRGVEIEPFLVGEDVVGGRCKPRAAPLASPNLSLFATHGVPILALGRGVVDVGVVVRRRRRLGLDVTVRAIVLDVKFRIVETFHTGAELRWGCFSIQTSTPCT